MKIIDAHSHIDYISHNFQSDVVGTVCCTTDESQWQNLIDIIKQDDNVFGAFGIHPWFVESITEGFDVRLEQLLQNNSEYMIGEIGIDKYKPDLDKQINIFKKQLDIAVKLQRVVFIHCVGAWDKMFNILKQYKKSDLPLIVAHGFNGSEEITDYLLKNYNVMFSFNTIVKTQYIQRIPIENILVETDGKKDVLLVDIINKIAEIKQNTNCCDIIYNNTQKVLKHG